MPREPFNTLWAQDPAQFEQPSDSLISTGWEGGITADAPRARWQNWYQNRVDYALQDIERMGAMTWHEDAQYSIGAIVSYNGGVYSSAVDGPSMGPSSGESNWYPITLGPASESKYGMFKKATQSQVNNGTGDSEAVTPAKMRLGVSMSLTPTGHIFLPTWLGGFCIQWGAASVEGGKRVSSSFSVPFPTACLQAVACDNADGTPSVMGVDFTQSSIIVETNETSGICRYIAVGY